MRLSIALAFVSLCAAIVGRASLHHPRLQTTEAMRSACVEPERARAGVRATADARQGYQVRVAQAAMDDLHMELRYASYLRERWQRDSRGCLIAPSLAGTFHTHVSN